MERSSVLTLKFNMSEYDFVTLQLVTVSAHTKREDFWSRRHFVLIVKLFKSTIFESWIISNKEEGEDEDLRHLNKVD